MLFISSLSLLLYCPPYPFPSSNSLPCHFHFLLLSTCILLPIPLEYLPLQRSPFIFLVSADTAVCIHTSEDSELGTTIRANVVFDCLDYLTPYNIFLFYPFAWKSHDFIFLYKWIVFHSVYEYFCHPLISLRIFRLFLLPRSYE